MLGYTLWSNIYGSDKISNLMFFRLDYMSDLSARNSSKILDLTLFRLSHAYESNKISNITFLGSMMCTYRYGKMVNQSLVSSTDMSNQTSYKLFCSYNLINIYLL